MRKSTSALEQQASSLLSALVSRALLNPQQKTSHVFQWTGHPLADPLVIWLACCGFAALASLGSQWGLTLLEWWWWWWWTWASQFVRELSKSLPTRSLGLTKIEVLPAMQ